MQTGVLPRSEGRRCFVSTGTVSEFLQDFEVGEDRVAALVDIADDASAVGITQIEGETGVLLPLIVDADVGHGRQVVCASARPPAVAERTVLIRAAATIPEVI